MLVLIHDAAHSNASEVHYVSLSTFPLFDCYIDNIVTLRVMLY